MDGKSLPGCVEAWKVVFRNSSGKDGNTVKKLLASLLVAGIFTMTIGCGTETKPATKPADKPPAASDKPKEGEKPK
jgi:hypothetical protein